MNLLTVAAATTALALPWVTASAEAQVYNSQYEGQSYGGQAYSSQGYGPYGQPYPAQAYGSACGSNCGDHRHAQGQRRYNSYNGQRDVPGDYRCDAYWDANRTDCNAAWRDQRPWRPTTQRRSYSSGYSYGGPAVYSGQYDGPDVVYSGNGYAQGGYGQYGRNQERINWCCAQYRSYDPATGYYTAYSGEHVFCG